MNATAYPGRLFDGRVALARPVMVSIQADRLELAENGASVLEWPFAGIGVETGEGETAVIHNGARLIVGDAAFRRDLKGAAPGLFPRPALRFALMSVPLLVLGALWLGWGTLTDTIVDHISPETERAMTRSMVDGIKPCATADQRESPLRLITVQLTARSNYPMPPDVWIVPGDTMNAVTLPGGRILIFDGLIQRARSSDQVAAVLAHELAHFEARDPLRQTLSGAGLSLLIPLLIGDTASGAVGRTLLLTRYSREAERAADDRAIDILASSNMRSDGLSKFLEETAADSSLPEVAAYLQTHPRTAERVARLRQRESAQGWSALNTFLWDKLRKACSSAGKQRP